MRSMARWLVLALAAAGLVLWPTAGREPRIDLRCEAAAPVRHVGIVFVHGIGSQTAGETLLDWGGAIVRALLDTRLRWRVSGDPVIDVQLEGGPSQSRWIEVQLPAVEVDGESVAEQHWVMTEAWWAQRVRPPSFGQMAEWLGPRGAIRRILAALLPRRGGAHDPRLRGWAEQHGLRRDDGGTEEIVTPGPPDGMARPPGRGPSRTISAIGAGMYLQAVSALLLVLYGLLRAIEKLIPIGPLRDGALTRPLDRFVLEWFGDVYVLLSDAAQTASIRGRLVDAITDLRSAGCDEIGETVVRGLVPGFAVMLVALLFCGFDNSFAPRMYPVYAMAAFSPIALLVLLIPMLITPLVG